MRKLFLILITYFLTHPAAFSQGKIGINTAAPKALLHVNDSSVVFSGPPSLLLLTPGNPPVSGSGSRMMWYSDKAAFRAGYINNNQWDRDSVGKYSFAAGENVKAIGVNSFAAGNDSRAQGNYSVAIGFNAETRGQSAVSLGENTLAGRYYSVAIGRNAIADDVDAVSIGLGTQALGQTSLAMGRNSVASGLYSIAIGNSNDATAQSSTALGAATLASGYNSLTTGYQTKADGFISFASGQYTIAKPSHSFVTGRYNDTAASSTNSWVATDPLFVIGNGNANDDRTNALTVLKNAQTGINMAVPIAALDIKGIGGTLNNHIRLEDNNTTNSCNIYYTGTMFFRNNVSGGDFIFENSAGTNIATLFSTGNLTIAGTLTQSSDARLKQQIRPLQNSLQKILSVNGYNYNWIDKNRDQTPQAGLLAQEIEKQMPELVKKDEQGIKSVNYSGIIPYLIEAMKEQQKKIESLEKENAEIRKLLPGK